MYGGWLNGAKISLLLLGLICCLQAQAQPKLSFFCELDDQRLESLFEDDQLIADLQEMGAELRIGLTDLSSRRAEIIQKLNQEGIPLVAWLLLPESDGYWFNVNNGLLATDRYAVFQNWTNQHNLVWDGIGIDLEPALEDVRLLRTRSFSFVGRGYERLLDHHTIKEGMTVYAGLLDKMHADGYRVESYIIPPILDERNGQTNSFQKMTGILDLKTSREISMCYTSAPFISPAMIPSYGKETGLVAIGSTGGGVDIGDGELPSLNWDELSRDLLLAQEVSDEIHIYSLEGCVQQGWIPLIRDFDFSQSVVLEEEEVEEVEKTRKKIQRILFWLMYPRTMTLLLVIVSGLLLLGIIRFFKEILQRIRR